VKFAPRPELATRRRERQSGLGEIRSSKPEPVRDAARFAGQPWSPASLASLSFEVRVVPYREAVHLQPVGELDLATCPKLDSELRGLLERGFWHVVIDLRDLTFIDAAGVRLLLKLAADSRTEHWRLSIIPGPDVVQRLFTLTDTLAALPFTTTLATAG
jgi:anti-anti-sigma factor